MSTKSPSATSGGNGGGRPPSVPRRRTSANGARPERAGQMKEKASLDAIYLVALTGYTDAPTRQRALARGFDAHVVKPIDSSRLSSMLAERTGTRNATPERSPA